MSEQSCSMESTPDLDEQEFRKMKAPNKKKFEEEVDGLMAIIHEKEAKHKTAKTDDGGQIEFKTLKAEIDGKIKLRQKIDGELQVMNREITKEEAVVSRMTSDLRYLNVDKMDHAIKNLEDRLKSQNFRLNEERRIVSEIDTLKRSRRTLLTYNTKRKEIDELRVRQRKMREESNLYSKDVSQLRKKLDAIKRKNSANRIKTDEVKKEIDELYAKKREMVSTFKSYEKHYYEMRDKDRKKRQEETIRKREEEKKAQMEQYQKELAEYEASCVPYEEQKQLCAALTAYLTKYLVNNEDGDNLSVVETAEKNDQSKGLVAEGMYLLRKKKSEEDLFGGSARPKSKRNKSDKRKASKKPIVHTPQIFSQFASLGLTAPSKVSEVQTALSQLEEKRKLYDSLPPPSKPLIHIEGAQQEENVSLDGSAGAPSYSESAISESIPSTPEVQFDNNPPQLLPGGDHAAPRRMSHDSGACELEDHSGEENLADGPDKEFVGSEEEDDDDKIHKGSQNEGSVISDNDSADSIVTVKNVLSEDNNDKTTEQITDVSHQEKDSSQVNVETKQQLEQVDHLETSGNIGNSDLHLKSHPSDCNSGVDEKNTDLGNHDAVRSFSKVNSTNVSCSTESEAANPNVLNSIERQEVFVESQSS